MSRALVLVLTFAALASAQDLTRSGDRLVLPSPIEFDIDSAEIRPRSFAVLDRVADWLRTNPEARIEIQAHTDPEWVCEHCGRRLTRDRARSVLAALVDRGIERTRLEARSFRGERPLARCEQRNRRARRACQMQNRRIELHLL